LAELPETIIVRGSRWSVIGIDDPENGHRRSKLDIPDSISCISQRSCRDSSLESIHFGLTSALRVLGGFVNCCVERPPIPLSVEVIEGGAFENCCLLAVLDFSFWDAFARFMDSQAVSPFPKLQSQLAYIQFVRKHSMIA
jgi:hypothetical protein